jgi:hypothetical protein
MDCADRGMADSLTFFGHFGRFMAWRADSMSFERESIFATFGGRDELRVFEVWAGQNNSDPNTTPAQCWGELASDRAGSGTRTRSSTNPEPRIYFLKTVWYLMAAGMAIGSN